MAEWIWRHSWRGESLKREEIVVATSEDRRADGRLGVVDFLVAVVFWFRFLKIMALAHHGHECLLTTLVAGICKGVMTD